MITIIIMKKIACFLLVVASTSSVWAHVPSVTKVGFPGFGYYPVCDSAFTIQIPEENSVFTLRQRKEFSLDKANVQHSVDVILTQKYKKYPDDRVDFPPLGIYESPVSEVSYYVGRHQWDYFLLVTNKSVAEKSCWAQIQKMSEENGFYILKFE